MGWGLDHKPDAYSLSFGQAVSRKPTFWTGKDFYEIFSKLCIVWLLPSQIFRPWVPKPYVSIV